MEIRENENVFILTPLSRKLDKKESQRILKNLLTESRESALDLSYVQDCTIEFIEDLIKIAKTKTLGIFNISSDIFVLFNLMNIDKNIKLFVNQKDFEENSRQLINRQFRVV